MDKIIEGLKNIFENQEIKIVNNKKYLINPLTDHNKATTFYMLDSVIKGILKIGNFTGIDKIIGEEERGGFIVSLISYQTKIPFSLAKWNPVGLDGEISYDFRNMYCGGKIFLNGIKPGDNIIIIEDMIDTGGTIISLIKLLQKHNINIVDIIAVSVKKEAKGIEKIFKETGFKIKYLCEFSVEGDRSKITKFNNNL